MDSKLHELAIEILAGHRIMTIATNRSDGYPQATIVGYVNNGLMIYFYIARLSQKYANIKRDPRVSAAIGDDFSEPTDIKGVSLAGTAQIVTASDEYDRAALIFLRRFPEYTKWPRPDRAFALLMKISPEIISILDYSRGFGHSDLISVTDGDLRQKISQQRSYWRAHSE